MNTDVGRLAMVLASVISGILDCLTFFSIALHMHINSSRTYIGLLQQILKLISIYGNTMTGDFL
ncbi:hypothetical protein C8R44DRAFT_796849 [Mycena epipterygia]|nr:hypothetical protein C8R44DRAFT_796849 [Mycena epipterygia]